MKVVVVKGGLSREREISLKTGHTFELCLHNLGHQVVSFELLSTQDQLDQLKSSSSVEALMKHDFSQKFFKGDIVDMVNLLQQEKPDLVFNALHGTFGEDGAIQGIFEMLNLTYTHSNVLTSALAMDKMKSKLLFEPSETGFTTKGLVIGQVFKA